MSLASIASAVWTSPGLPARSIRAILQPTSWLFGRIVARRNARYDRSTPTATMRALSVGNLTVGGTGKTPFAAWCVQRLRAKGERPAIVMRGVGDDEWRVHGVLNPGVQVVVSPDRIAGMHVARTRGASCAVLDDAFQHRRAARDVDIVLLSADQWTGAVRLLPAGPFREPLSSLQRADVAVITVKDANAARVDDVLAAVRIAAPRTPCAIARLRPGALQLAATLLQQGQKGASRGSTGPMAALLSHPPEWLAGREICVVSAIGDPAAFEAQIRSLGAQIRAARRFPDHYAYTVADATAIASQAAGTVGVVCTLKDAVKLAAVWPREAPPLWYLSQSVVVERGVEALDRAFARVLASRAATAPTAG